MEIAWTSADIERLRRSGRLDTVYLGYAPNLFNQLREALAEAQPEDFSLAGHGPIVLLERGDDIRRLK